MPDQSPAPSSFQFRLKTLLLVPVVLAERDSRFLLRRYRRRQQHVAARGTRRFRNQLDGTSRSPRPANGSANQPADRAGNLQQAFGWRQYRVRGRIRPVCARAARAPGGPGDDHHRRWGEDLAELVTLGRGRSGGKPRGCRVHASDPGIWASSPRFVSDSTLRTVFFAASV